jgi:hypothetical protein
MGSMVQKSERKVQKSLRKVQNCGINKIIYIFGSDLPHCHHITSKLVACIWYTSHPSLAAQKYGDISSL